MKSRLSSQKKKLFSCTHHALKTNNSKQKITINTYKSNQNGQNQFSHSPNQVIRGTEGNARERVRECWVDIDDENAVNVRGQGAAGGGQHQQVAICSPLIISMTAGAGVTHTHTNTSMVFAVLCQVQAGISSSLFL